MMMKMKWSVNDQFHWMFVEELIPFQVENHAVVSWSLLRNNQLIFYL